jgi:hypothetical protein
MQGNTCGQKNKEESFFHFQQKFISVFIFVFNLVFIL